MPSPHFPHSHPALLSLLQAHQESTPKAPCDKTSEDDTKQLSTVAEDDKDEPNQEEQYRLHVQTIKVVYTH